MCITFWFNS